MPNNASANIQRTRRRFQEELRTREEVQQRFRATIGDGAGNVEVVGKRNYVYIRREGRSRIEECHNTKVPRRNGLPVIVGHDPVNPDTLQILEPDWGGMASPDNYPYVPYHHESHEFDNPDGGDDVTWIQSQQYVPLLAYPTDPLTMTVNIYGGWYCWGVDWHYFEATISADLTGSIPGIVGNARYTLISIDGATEALQYTDGAEFPVALPPADIEDMIPVAPSGSVPVVAVYLPNGITSIGWANLYDIRMMVATAGMVVPHAHSAAGDGGDQIRPDRIGVNTAVPGTDGVIAMAETVDPADVPGVGMSYFKDDAGQTKQYFEDDTGHVFEVAGIVRDLIVTVGVAGDFATIQDAVDWFKNWIVKGTCVIDCDADTYAEEVTFKDILVARGAQLVLQGDIRALAGISYVDGANCNRGNIANGGNGIVTLSNAGDDITVDMSGIDPDFDAGGWGNGDRVIVYDNTDTIAIYTIDSVAGNVITLTVAAPDVGNDSTAIALIPNRAIDGTGAGGYTLGFEYVSGIKIDGWYLYCTLDDHYAMYIDLSSSIQVENLLAYGNNGGAIFVLNGSTLIAGIGTITTTGAESIWSSTFQAADKGTAWAMYLVGVATMIVASASSHISATLACVVHSFLGYVASITSTIVVTDGTARQCGTGYYAECMGYIFASDSVVNCNGNVTDYDPSPSSTFGNENGSIYYT